MKAQNPANGELMIMPQSEASFKRRAMKDDAPNKLEALDCHHPAGASASRVYSVGPRGCVSPMGRNGKYSRWSKIILSKVGPRVTTAKQAGLVPVTYFDSIVGEMNVLRACKRRGLNGSLTTTQEV